MNSYEFGGDLVRSNGVYTVRDNRTLNHLTLSQTILHVSQCTTSHYHEGQEEIYFFAYGRGSMVVGEQRLDVCTGSIILIPDGLFHKVWNTGESDLIFNCVFDGRRTH